MPSTILGLDIGGANLKAATADKRAVSVPFALWKQPNRLPVVLAELVGRFPDTDELAVTMTGELCDCFETKRDGVAAILNAVRNVSRSRPVHVWSTDGVFVDTETAQRHHLKVASANWHALATLAGRFTPDGIGLLIDIGSTTTDIIPLVDELPATTGRTDPERMAHGELVYVGVRRTPLCAILGFDEAAAELFATTLDAYLLLDQIPEDPTDTDTADGRPATHRHAHARLARMKCEDVDHFPVADAVEMACIVHRRIVSRLTAAGSGSLARQREILRRRKHVRATIITSGSGEFLAREVADLCAGDRERVLSLSDQLGPEVSACAPAYAVAVLATERRP